MMHLHLKKRLKTGIALLNTTTPVTKSAFFPMNSIAIGSFPAAMMASTAAAENTTREPMA